MCVGAEKGHVFCAEAVVAAAQETLARIQSSVLRGRVIWVARQEVVARALAGEFGGPAVVLDSGDSFAPWNAAYQAMDRDLGHRSSAQARESFLALAGGRLIGRIVSKGPAGTGPRQRQRNLHSSEAEAR